MNNTYFYSEIPHPLFFFGFLPVRHQFFDLFSEQLGKGWQKTIFGHV